MKATQTELAALAALVSITPETHRYLFSNACSCGSIDLDEVTASGNTSYVCAKCGLWNSHHEIEIDNPKVANLPSLDTPAGDDVYLAPFLRWALDNLERAPYINRTPDGWYMAHAPVYGEASEKRFAKSMVAALILACQSANVPEVVEIFGSARA